MSARHQVFALLSTGAKRLGEHDESHGMARHPRSVVATINAATEHGDGLRGADAAAYRDPRITFLKAGARDGMLPSELLGANTMNTRPAQTTTSDNDSVMSVADSLSAAIRAYERGQGTPPLTLLGDSEIAHFLAGMDSLEDDILVRVATKAQVIVDTRRFERQRDPEIAPSLPFAPA